MCMKYESLTFDGQGPPDLESVGSPGPDRFYLYGALLVAIPSIFLPHGEPFRPEVRADPPTSRGRF